MFIRSQEKMLIVEKFRQNPSNMYTEEGLCRNVFKS